MDLNFFDIIIVAVVSFCLVRGLFRGLIREVASIVGVVAAFYTAYTCLGAVTPLVGRYVADPGYRNIVGFSLIFVGVILLVNLLAWLIRSLVNIVFLGWFDRVCGMGFGAVKGCLIISVMMIGLASFVPRGEDIIAESKLCVHVSTVSGLMSSLVHGQAGARLKNHLEGIRQIWENQKKDRQNRV